jgi:hypothetical protein
MKQVPVNIKVKFGNEMFYLEQHTDRAKSEKSGVVIWGRMHGPAFKPMAEIPDGTLEKYMHCRPEIIACDWVAT